MINHVNLVVRNINESKKFFQAALAPLGYRLLAEHPKSAGFGQEDVEGKRDFWLKQGSVGENRSFSCLAFTAKSKEEVDGFHKIAVRAGAKDNGRPGCRLKYHEGYYAAYVIDPNGYNIEAVWDDLEKLGIKK